MIRRVAVIDIGKTNAKVALVDLALLREITVRKQPNRVLPDGPYPHYDVEALWRFILGGLREINAEEPVDAVCVTTHGAAAALLDGQGGLALPVLDYEHSGPDELAAEYAAGRPDFDATGSPRLPAGLNLGAQLFWQARRFPEAFAKVAAVATYAQYWSWRLSGVLANEVTSLGCHTDLWNPRSRDYSPLVDALGWRRLMAPVRAAADRLGPILPEIAASTGMARATPVFCGIHDSNASLLPHLLSRGGPFSVVSTGTWVVSMAVRGRPVRLDPDRDTLINVDALGDPVPSARFMGGRELEMLAMPVAAEPSPADAERVVERRLMLLPSIQQGSGPFAGRTAEWLPGAPETDAEKEVAASFYLALMTATCLDLAGAEGPTVVEGPFARNRLFSAMLATATGREVLADRGAATGTSIGAALLAAAGRARALGEPARHEALDGWKGYAAAWREAAG